MTPYENLSEAELSRLINIKTQTIIRIESELDRLLEIRQENFPLSQPAIGVDG